MAEARLFGTIHEEAAPPSTFANTVNPSRRLRIGYVSPDFREHSVAWFLEPLLRAHDRETVEVFCYAQVVRPDAVSGRFQALANHWRNTVGLTDGPMAECIRQDGIDILVDLAGHTANNRLRVFACKPAPVQITWLGYPGTTGLSRMDYRLVDSITDPEDEGNALSSEALLRLPDGFLCYGPPAAAPEPADSTLPTAPVTFGSFNNPSKLSSSALDVWAALLTRLPGTQLYLKGGAFADPTPRNLFLGRLKERGIDPARITLAGTLPRTEDHLALYGKIDIALDPFPYNGTTTTCEALWMGVPVVTLRGDRHSGRVGASLLTRLGLEDLIAEDVEDYIEIAAALARNQARRAALRRSLRQLMTSSPLCNSEMFARNIESVFLKIWRRWCNGLSAAPFDLS